MIETVTASRLFVALFRSVHRLRRQPFDRSLVFASGAPLWGNLSDTGAGAGLASDSSEYSWGPGLIPLTAGSGDEQTPHPFMARLGFIDA